jgi:ABC-type taurine transport system substrate-binding protein
MYTVINFKTKKALKEAVKAYSEYAKNPDAWILANSAPSSVAAVSGVKRPRPVETFQPGPFPAKTNGTVCLEGPHYPAPHTWYATAEIKDGIVLSVK